MKVVLNLALTTIALETIAVATASSVNVMAASPVGSNQPANIDHLSLFTRQKGPGLAYVVLQNGKIIRQGAYGYADREKKIPIATRSPFIIGSLTKQITAAAILLLEKDGKLDENDLASKYVRDLPAYANEVRIRHLLHHQSGLPDYAELCKISPNSVSNAEIMAFLKTKTKLTFPAGSRFEYSNTGYVILAEVIKSVSGLPFPDFLRERIFKPSGMIATYQITLETEPAFQQKMHSYKGWPFFEVDDRNPCNYKQGPGGIVSNLEDFAQWLRTLENGTLFPQQWLTKMYTPAPLENGDPTHYADGWMLGDLRGQKLIWHNGSWLSFRTYVGRLPERGSAVVVFSNYGGLDAEEIGKQLLIRAN